MKYPQRLCFRITYQGKYFSFSLHFAKNNRSILKLLKLRIFLNSYIYLCALKFCDDYYNYKIRF